MNQGKTQPVTIRIPLNVYESLVKISQSEHRSLNSQVVYFLEKSSQKFERDQKQLER
jgi:hypothetical protein